MNPETTYLQHLESIERIAACVARKKNLNADERGEFVQVVRVRLFENDYAIIRKFEGRSEFTTYLTTVIGRIYNQCLVEEKGKWRPSAEAGRLGKTAVRLERMLTRDGYTFAEAVQILTTPEGSSFTVDELEALYVRLPVRSARPVLVSSDVVPDAVAVDGDADDRLESRDRENVARRIMQVIDETSAKFDPEDRLIVQMRFTDARKVPDIANVLRLDQKKLYKRLDKIFDRLRQPLEAAGISKEDVDKIVGRPDQEIHLDILPREENTSPRPSKPTGEKKVRGGGGKLP